MTASFLAVVAVVALAGCANDSKPEDHAEFAEKWVNAVSHIDGQDLNCRIATDWYSSERTGETCQNVFDVVQQQYLNVQYYFRQEGGVSSATSLSGATFDCKLDEREGTAEQRASTGLKLPVSCLDGDGMGLKVYLDNFSGSADNYAIYQVEGDTKFWN
ncbi:hypothetical protein [Microlunatus speluncae]|uniref:hypothetical protein n=1 Tax=Microlunatus speluncae TaxID=2594267 RepID=UPI00126676D1|nr:hypothetical protein [Microlunatus speluncae]